MITISPGHWKYSGSGANGLINEVIESRKVTNEVVKILRASGITTSLIEDDISINQKQNLTYLVAEHNRTSRKLDVSIHFNSSAGTSGKGIGTEVLYFDTKELAAKVSKAISNATGGGLLNRGAKQRKELTFLANTNKPAILIELCFVNSSVDTAIYRRDFNKICQAIANELAAYVGKTIGTASTTIEQKYDVVAENDAKKWRIQSGPFDSKENAIKAFEQSGLRYATIKGTAK